MIYAASKFMALLSTVGSWMVILLGGAVLLLWSPGWWRAGRRLATLLLLLLGILAFSPLQPTLTAQLENRFARPQIWPDDVDGIIVLGGMIRPNISKARGQPSLNDAAERLIEAARLAARYPGKPVLFTGGSADPWRPEAKEAAIAAQLLGQMGVAPDRLILESESRNTYENAVFSRKIISARPGETWILVTSALHMPRAVGVFRRAGWHILPCPVNYLTGGETDWANEDIVLNRLYVLSRTLHEWAGLLYYRARGWSDSLFPR